MALSAKFGLFDRNSEILNLESIKGQQKNKSTIMCSKALQEKIGGKSELLKLSRSFGSTNIIVLDKEIAKRYNLVLTDKNFKKFDISDPDILNAGPKIQSGGV